MIRRLRGLISLLVALAVCQWSVPPLASPPPVIHRQTSASVYLLWIRVDPNAPRVLFVGLSSCPPDPGQRDCSASWVGRSADAGATWTDLSPALGNLASIRQAGQDSDYYWNTDPIVISRDSSRLYAVTSQQQGDSAHAGISQSVDNGLHWIDSGGGFCGDGTYGGMGNLALSPVDAQRVYTVADAMSVSCGVYYSDDAGLTFHKGSDPSTSACHYAVSYRPWGPLVADPVSSTTVYANVTNYASVPTVCSARSDDGGVTWSQIVTPTASPPLQTFTVGTDPHYGPVLVGQSADTSVPADRRYISTDQGRTWSTTTCAGDLGGVCPSFVVDNVFGAGASYAFLGNGVYRFHGSGPAEERLALSDRLPLALQDLVDVAAGQRAGAPIYLLGLLDRLYRSTDEGRHWQRLAVGNLPGGPLPYAAPPSHAPNTLYIPRAHHSVAPPFIATYHRLSPLILGDPVSEAYWDRGVLRQDFDHLGLELRAGKVHVADLGAKVAVSWGLPTADDPGSFRPVRPVSSTATLLYFPQTHHTLRGDMLRFWRTHGGMALFGAPISEVAREYNQDGSGQQYAMQWFQNARLERHPETDSPKYAILLGLLGHNWWPEPR